MQVEILPIDDDGQVQHQFNSSTIPKLQNVEDEWEGRGTWLIRHHRKTKKGDIPSRSQVM
eukprot:9543189-Prorocentrum_lima.AAC.1